MSCKKAQWLPQILWVFLVSHVSAQDVSWETYMYRAEKAFRQGDYDDAENSVEAALEKAEQFGPEDPRLAASLNNLAFLYHTQGRYAEAEPLYRRALTVKEKTLGTDHPTVASSLNNLANLYNAQGKYADAEPLYQMALVIVEKVLGPHHPNVATAMENYAALLRKTNRSAEAEKLEERAKAIWSGESEVAPQSEKKKVE
jgi:tetratricopeptide (TPR) repeat protein